MRSAASTTSSTAWGRIMRSSSAGTSIRAPRPRISRWALPCSGMRWTDTSQSSSPPSPPRSGSCRAGSGERFRHPHTRKLRLCPVGGVGALQGGGVRRARQSGIGLEGRGQLATRGARGCVRGRRFRSSRLPALLRSCRSRDGYVDRNSVPDRCIRKQSARDAHAAGPQESA